MKQPLNDEKLKRLAQVLADSIAREYNHRYKSKIPVPVPLEFDLELTKPRVAGIAVTERSVTATGTFQVSSQRVQLNMTLFRDNVHEFLNGVLPHEMAHLKQAWDDVKNQATSTDHGYVWQLAMREMSQVPKATHKMDTSKAVKVYKEHKAKKRKKEEFT